MARSTPSFPDHNQNFWQLASIQGASQSIWALLTGGILAKQFGTLTALASIGVGNLLLWLIGLGVVSLSAKNRQNTIQTVQEHLGKSGSLLMVFVLTSAFILWYTIELQITVDALAPLFPIEWRLEFVGLGLGIMVALLSIGGIRLIKWVCIISFPFLLCFVVYLFFNYGQFNFDGNWELSFSAIVTVVSLILPGTVNFPTFFRHSRSRADSILALTLIALYFVLFQILGVSLALTTPVEILGNHILSVGSMFYAFPMILFIFVLFICLNLVNIYFASAGFEVFLPRLSVSKGYFIIGLLGSLFYFFVKSSSWIITAENVMNNFIVNLGGILLVSFFVKTLAKHRPRKLEKWINYSCWLVGCLVMIITQRFYPENVNKIFLSGIWATLLTFIFVVFIEEAVYSYKLIKQGTERWE